MRFFLVLLLTACATKPVARPPGQEDLLFPDGRYQQDAQVAILIAPAKQNFDFNAFVQKDAHEFLFVGYNSFGITLFKIHQKAGQVIESESPIEAIQKHREFFLKIFRLVKTIISLHKSDPRLQKNEILLNEEDLQARVRFADFDSLGIPLQIRVESEGQYQTAIKTNSYKLKMETDRH